MNRLRARILGFGSCAAGLGVLLVGLGAFRGMSSAGGTAAAVTSDSLAVRAESLFVPLAHAEDDPGGPSRPGAAIGPFARGRGPTARKAESSAPCPDGMVLVERDHWDVLEHKCIDRRGKHCFAYEPGASTAEPPQTHVRVCMDRYEAPNERGAKPLVMVSGIEAERYCQARGKRLCSEMEWESACEGPQKLPYVYGYRERPGVCNSDKPWRAFDERALSAGGERAAREVARLWQGEPSGARSACVSHEGVHDLVGNVEEWVTSRPGRRFRLALMGGFWSKPWTGCRGTNDAHEPGFRFYEVGFRCCADPR
jgi:hypothetical protein